MQQKVIELKQKNSLLSDYFGGYDILKKNKQYRLILNQIFQECERIYHNAAISMGLTDCGFKIMYMLYDNHRIYTQTELCEISSLSKQTINSAVKKLEKQGYLQIVSIDKKSKGISLSQKGMIFAEHNIKKVIQAEEYVFNLFSLSDNETFIKTYDSILQNLKKELEK